MTVSHETARVDFGIVPGRIVNEVLTAHLGDIVDLVRDTYLAHEDARASNPHSHFLTFPDRPRDRIIALESGRIVEQGTHSSLLAAGGRYAELHRRQMGTTVTTTFAAGGGA